MPILGESGTVDEDRAVVAQMQLILAAEQWVAERNALRDLKEKNFTGNISMKGIALAGDRLAESVEHYQKVEAAIVAGTPENDRDKQDAVMKGLTEGRIVHYVLSGGRHPSEHRPAIVVKVWRDGEGKPPANGVSQLVVFLDGTSDYATPLAGSGDVLSMWATSVLNDEDTKLPGTWHWIERA